MTKLTQIDYPMLLNKDNGFINKIKDELNDTMDKRQKFRTETEMRFSVLNDGKHPTKASKYWQCVREQGVFIENLHTLSFEYRRNLVKLNKKQKRLEFEEKDEFKKEYLQIDIDECRWIKAQQESVAKDRVREIEHWSRLKKELDDGSFNTKDVNAHQAKSYEKNLINRKNTLTPGSSQAEVINVLGPLQTLQRLNRGDKLSNDTEGVTIPMAKSNNDATKGVTIPVENTNRKTIPPK